MPGDPQMRASDEDRDRTSALLREHHAAGRLTVDEFQERLDATYAAKTLGELDAQLKDLPGIDLYQLPDVKMRRDQALSPVTPGRLSPAWRAAWGSWVSTSLVLFVIWLITGGTHGLNDLWFLWIAGPWGAILLGRWLTGSHPGGHQGHSHQGHGHSHQSQPLAGPPGELGGVNPGRADL